ncbi:MAG: aminotransferase [Alphaproteobacteria bacterium]
MPHLSNAAVRDIETLIHPYTNLAGHRDKGPVVIERGEGIYVWDDAGKQYIEGMSGLWCSALGYGNAELTEAVVHQLEKISFTHLFGGKSHDTAIALAEKLKEISPAPASKVLFASSGSEANDQQVKLQWYYNNALGRPEKKKIISRWGGYHGVTAMAASLTGLPVLHTEFDLPLDRILHTDNPHFYKFAEAGETEKEFSSRLAENLEKLILAEGPQTIAAFIAEPIMGAGGVILPPETYFAKIQAVLAKYDIQLIADEVICGFGRTGEWFGSQTFDLSPDTISVAKALTSATLPLSAITIAEPVYQAMLDQSKKIGTFGHGHTYTGHPVACAVGLKVLEIFERDNIVGHVRAVAPRFAAGLARLADHPLVGDTRGVGLIGGVELAADRNTKRAFDPKHMVGANAVANAEANGLILRVLPNDSIALCPPLIISEDQIDVLFERLTAALDTTLDWVTKNNLRAVS